MKRRSKTQGHDLKLVGRKFRNNPKAQYFTKGIVKEGTEFKQRL